MLKDVPTQLGLLIDRYNGYPIGREPPSLGQASIDGSMSREETGGFSVYETIEARWTEQVRFELAKNLICADDTLIDFILGDDTDFVGGIGSSTKEEIFVGEFELLKGYDGEVIKEVSLPTMGFVERYEEFLSLRFNLDLVIAFAFRHPSWRTSIEATKLGFSSRTGQHMLMLREGLEIPNYSFSPLVLGSNNILAGEDGLASVKIDDLASAITGLEIFRIRRCAVCLKAFWAGNVLQFWCCKECKGQLKSKLNRVSTWPEEEREEFNRKRRENYKLRMVVRKPITREDVWERAPVRSYP
ncbi:MAG: hypothetical protein DWQ47_16505 [Acidobacteria bacterium]|nr:MAG: hypothetical protein DWQ32_03905 [Acidobacteriota bacterium]REK02348.1 MAG: hypothetical protein DWQ38_08235 [Acidobacteriota bacterium]REK13850.1 MAG: hypothetical protein DWQ43_09595 [Acidobacteriota bacterium]REK41845.1 MAG: hypothetical protein DWQ47_16505 [Acidobacteriota bacterium]